jgi:hypothetical protein
MKSRTLISIAAMTVLAALTTPIRLAALVSGSGTTNFIPKWTGSTTLGNSILFQTGGKVGIGTTTPAATLDVKGLNGSAAINGGNAPMVLRVIGGSGVGVSFTEVGAGGSILMMGGTGARSACIIGDGCAIGGTGGSITLQPGAGGIGQRPGRPANIILALSGRVGVGTSSPSATLDVATGPHYIS